MHKHQMKPATVDHNISAPTGKISHKSEKEDGRAKSKTTMKNHRNTEEFRQMMCNLCNSNQHLMWKLRHSQEIY